MKNRILAFMLALSLLLGLTAYASESTDPSGDEPVELTMLSMPANTSGIAGGWWGEELEKHVGIRLNLLPSGDQGEQKLQALMASGDLPDLLVFKDYKQAENAVDGDMLLAFDDYKDMLPNLYANAPEALRFSAENLSLGKGKSYVVGCYVKNAPETRGYAGPYAYLRYDLYKEAGAPAFHNGQELLDVLQAMHELEPVNADGQKTYALSIFKDWDRAYMALGNFYVHHMGGLIQAEGFLSEVHFTDPSGPTFLSLTDEDSLYMDYLRFLFDLNQMGLLDPDSMTQRFEDMIQKIADGRVLCVMDGWGTGDFNTVERQDQGIGFMPVFYSDVKRGIDPLQLEGTAWTFAVSNSTQYAEQAMKFIDWLYSYEGARISHNGPKGVTWDIGDDGKPVLLERKYEIDRNPDQEFAGGKSFAQGGPTIGTAGLWSSSVDPANGSAVHYNYWMDPPYAPEVRELLSQWREDYGALDPINYIMQDESRYYTRVTATVPTMTDEMEQISARVGDIIKNESWKMVFAADEAEFNALKEQMMADAKEVGIDAFTEWNAAEYTRLWNEAKQ